LECTKVFLTKSSSFDFLKRQDETFPQTAGKGSGRLLFDPARCFLPHLSESRGRNLL
jgi:hypothetical protein